MLLLAAGLPANGWEISDLVRLLRNSRLTMHATPAERAAAAWAIADCRIFRDLEQNPKIVRIS